MKTPQKKISFRQWRRLYILLRSQGFFNVLLVLLFPLLVGLIMLRNDHSPQEDLLRLVIFTACTAVWWYTNDLKSSPHAQLRKPLLLESPPKKLHLRR